MKVVFLYRGYPQYVKYMNFIYSSHILSIYGYITNSQMAKPLGLIAQW